MHVRTRLAATVAALALSAPLAVVATAAAAPATPEVKRTISIEAVEPGDNNVFFAKGRVRPSYENRYAIMQRKLEDAKKWKDWKKFKTNGKSRYRKEIKALNRVGVVCYRVKIKESGRFETSFSLPVCIRTKPA
jgi:hypothetical protein